MNPARIALGIDGGGSSSRWLLQGEGGVILGAGRVGAISGNGAQLQGALEALDRLLLEVLLVARPDALVAGVTGLHPGTESYRRFAETIGLRLELPPDRLHLTNDMHLAYASAFAPGAGVLVYAGTGSIAYHVTGTGEVVRAGGYGYLIDDAGGGFWLGREALKWLLRARDSGVNTTTPLADALYTALGSRAWPEIVPRVYGGGRTFVASLAPVLARAAEAGDAVAQRLLVEAGLELSLLVKAVESQLGGALPVAFAGGLTRLSPRLTGALQRELGRDVSLVTREPVEVAARLALEGGLRG